MGRSIARRLPLLLALGLGVGPFACASRRNAPTPPPSLKAITPDQGGLRSASDQDDLLARVVEAHNAERARRRLPPLVPNPRLDAAALVQAEDMAGRRRMSHKGSDGSSPFDRIGRQGYRFRAAGENVAYGFDEVEQVMDGWMRSPGHRRNILGDYAEIGVGRAVDQGGSAYWSVTFGTPLAAQIIRTTSVRGL